MSTAFERGKQNVLTLTWSEGKGGKVSTRGGYEGKRYLIKEWRRAGQP